jgi:histidinol-phosphate aminotransferase
LQTIARSNIIVRYFKKDKISDFVRITIGTQEEMDALIAATKEILEDC